MTRAVGSANRNIAVQTPDRTPRPNKGPTACPEFGAGFVRMPGSETCIRFSGSVGVGVGGSSSR